LPALTDRAYFPTTLVLTAPTNCPPPRTAPTDHPLLLFDRSYLPLHLTAPTDRPTAHCLRPRLLPARLHWPLCFWPSAPTDDAYFPTTHCLGPCLLAARLHWLRFFVPSTLMLTTRFNGPLLTAASDRYHW